MAQKWEPQNGSVNPKDHYTLFKNANIYQGDGEYLSNASLLIYKNKIVAVGELSDLPENLMEYDLKGKFIYPSFVELSSHFGIRGNQAKKSAKPQLESLKKGPFYWNESVKSEYNAKDLLHYDSKEAKRLRSLGFGAVLTHQGDGILRGTGSLIGLNDQNQGDYYLPISSFHYSFNKGTSNQTYPSSLMGMIALIRQSKFDAMYYLDNPELDYNASLDAINAYSDLPQIFSVESHHSILRAQKIALEFGQKSIIQGNGEEYKIARNVNLDSTFLIVPLNFPKAFNVSNPYDNRHLNLAQLKKWEMAPKNLAILEKQNVPFAITSNKLKDSKSFFKNIQSAIENGLPRHKAIDALTSIPAKQLSVDLKIGKLSKDFFANFIITEDTLFGQHNHILENWVSGQQYQILPWQVYDLEGDYNLVINEKEQFLLKLRKQKGKWSAVLSEKDESKTYKTALQLDDNKIKLSFTKGEESYILVGYANDRKAGILSGQFMSHAKWKDWAAVKKPSYEDKKDAVEKDSNPPSQETAIQYPNMAYGWDSLPNTARPIIFRNATLWTNESEGILRNHDLLIHDGKIQMIGYKIDVGIHFPQLVNSILEIDAKGKHITSGIVDEHSHIAIQRGVNESGQTVTAEVSIGDVIRPDDINIYRQLAGGVTTSQLLHGSANPIGGQSALIKLKWGRSAEEMKINDAPKFIKFALGENVKQSNWGDRQNVRFPQTRMGVEQVFYDAFYRARSYKDEWTLWDVKSKKEKKKARAPRRDLELEALVEILDSNRFITCHSYIQSEINMLMHMADSMDIQINTFTHILEGYKVADKMKAHGAAGSTFSDWWAYKYEVNDAIPYNGAVMHDNGILTGFNSDDAEMGRRLNQEAAKAIKYGGVKAEEAWKFVTLNPAKMLHLDDRIGSLKVGKDADLVLWSDQPMSINAIAEQTYIEGIKYFDIERNAAMQLRDGLEKERLILKMANHNNKGGATQEVVKEEKHLYECNTIEQ